MAAKRIKEDTAIILTFKIHDIRSLVKLKLELCAFFILAPSLFVRKLSCSKSEASWP